MQMQDRDVEAICPFTGLVVQYKTWGQEVAAEEYRKPPMLLLHNAGEQFYCWEHVAEVLTRGFCCPDSSCVCVCGEYRSLRIRTE